MNLDIRRRRRPRPRVEALEARQLLSVAGTPDATFGVGGLATAPVIAPSASGARLSASEVATVAGPGGVVDLVGTLFQGSQQYLSITQLANNGVVDTTYGSAGQETVPVGKFTVSGAYAQGGSRIVVAGSLVTTDAATGRTTTSFGALRFTATGQLDPTFGVVGAAFFPIDGAGGTPAIGAALDASALESNGDLVVAGIEAGAPFVARITAGGQLDTTFGGTGVVDLPAVGPASSGQPNQVIGVATGFDGVIAVSGAAVVGKNPPPPVGMGPTTYNYESFVTQLDANGTVDDGFAGSTSGTAIVADDVEGPVAYLSTGHILVVGSTRLAELNADGTPDTTVGANGIAAVALPFSGTPLLQGNGGIVISGPDQVATGTTTAVEAATFRLNTDLTPDPTYGNTATPGLALFPKVPSSATAAIATDGSVILAGVLPAGSEPYTAFAASRILGAAAAGPADPSKVGGALDSTFGGGKGYVTAPVAEDSSGTYSTGIGLAAEPDGQSLVASYQASSGMILLRRFAADGTLDASTSVPFTTPEVVTAVAVQPDGKILVAAYDDIAPANFPQAVVLRFNDDATLSADTAFGTAGQAKVTDLNLPGGLAVQPDGKILLAGTFDEPLPQPGAGSGGSPATSAEIFGVDRLDADGALDTTFGTGGVALAPFPISNASSFPDLAPSQASANSVAIQPDGKIVLVGTAVASFVGNSGPGLTTETQIDAAVARFDADGTLDATFGGSSSAGQVLIPGTLPGVTGAAESLGGGVAIQADGKIVVGEYLFSPGTAPTVTTSSTGLAAFRLDPDGTPDSTFGTGGQGTVDVVASTSGAFYRISPALALQADGGVLVAGTLGQSVVVGRLTAAGVPDPAFGASGTAGVAATPITSDSSNSLEPEPALAAQPDGKILVAGVETGYPGSTSAAPTAVVLARLLPARLPTPANQQAPDDFGGDGVTDLTVYLPSLGEFAIRRSSGGADVFVPFGFAGAGETIPAVGDYTGAGHAEIGAYLPSLGLFAYRPADGSPDVVEPFGIPGVGQAIPAPGDYTGTGKDDLAIYLPSIGAFAIRPADGGPDEIIPFGLAGAGASIPVPGDYDGSGRTEIAVYMPSLAEFAYRPANGGPDVLVPFGLAGVGQTLPAPGDYDGSGKTEIAAYLPSLGLFAYRPAGGGADVLTPFGAPNDGSVPVPGDYDGSGHDDIAIFDPSAAVFAIRPSKGADVLEPFGIPGVGRSIPAAALADLVVTPASPYLVTSAPLTRSVAVAISSTAATTVVPAVPSGPSALTRRATRTVVAQAPDGAAVDTR